MRNEWTRKSSISGGVCGEELDEYCFHLQSTKKRNNSYIFIEECILGHVFVSLFKHLFRLTYEIINFCSLFSRKVFKLKSSHSLNGVSQRWELRLYHCFLLRLKKKKKLACGKRWEIEGKEERKLQWRRELSLYYFCATSTSYLTWDQPQFSFRFENNIPAGKAKRK